MEVNIKNHSDGSIAGVTRDQQLKVQSEALSLQHFIAREYGQTYQLPTLTATLTSATTTVLHIANNDPERDMIISYMRMGIVDSNATMPAVGEYFQIGCGTTYSSGGTAATPVNTNQKSGKTVTATAYGNSPTVTGTFTEIERWYPNADGDREKFNKDGSVILGLSDTLEVRFVGTATAGNAWARITLMMLDKE